MFEKKVVVTSDAGVHARPSMMIVKEAMKYENCSVEIVKDEVTADCKSIMTVLGLAMIKGAELTVRANGKDEEEIVETIVSMIESGFPLDEK